MPVILLAPGPRVPREVAVLPVGLQQPGDQLLEEGDQRSRKGTTRTLVCVALSVQRFATRWATLRLRKMPSASSCEFSPTVSPITTYRKVIGSRSRTGGRTGHRCQSTPD